MLIGLILFCFGLEMHLSDKEFNKLQKLANISFSVDEKEVFLEKLEWVIDFLGQLKKQWLVDEEQWKLDLEYLLKTNSWINEYENSKWLLDNVKHEIVNNSIVVKSVFA